MAGCNHDCENCAQKGSCSEIPKAKLNDRSSIKHVVCVLSGKGGVGKSFVTSSFAVALHSCLVAVIDRRDSGQGILHQGGEFQEFFRVLTRLRCKERTALALL